MAIKFEDTPASKPTRKEVGGKTYVAEEPSANAEKPPADKADPASELPFAKPVKAEKKGRKLRQK